LAPLKLADVPELYWTLVAWAGAIASDKEDMDLVADLHLIEPMVRRCVELDEDYDAGALHEFLVSFEGGRSESQGGSAERARRHSERALQLSGNRKLGPLVSLAETVSVSAQDRREFEQLLQQCLAFDVNSAPEYRLSNLLAQKRARLLLAQIDDLFIEN
jgi:predicted anti-sigma-YlaC factor YlaD